MFFEQHYEDEVKDHIKINESKIFLTAEFTHARLKELVSADKLPKEYGGNAEAEAGCIYSERGPWTEIENKVNYKTMVENPHHKGGEEESKGLDKAQF
jgi:hypothetical protein